MASLVKSVLRHIIYFRLKRLPLSMAEAEYWADKFKRWPAIFGERLYRKKVEVNPGVYIWAGLIDVIQRNLIVHAQWDPKILRTLKMYLKPGATFLDIGANIGYFTLIASSLVGRSGTVVAFEPSLRAIELLSANLRLNQVQNVVIYSIAVGKESALGTFYQATPNNIGASSLCQLASAVGIERVPVYRLDDLLEPMGFRPDVVKIDVEGFELDVIRGMEVLLRRSRPVVLCEVTVEWIINRGQDPNDMLKLMEDLGYSTFVIREGAEITFERLKEISSTATDFKEEILFRCDT